MNILNMISIRLALLAMAIFSLMAVSGALVAQFAFDMPPCILCIYQRIPYGVVFLVGMGAFLTKKAESASLFIIAFTFFVNSCLAIYHSGIERQWWSESSGCSVSFDFHAQGTQNLLEQITSAQTGSCADIPWIDPILGLSMANYNAFICFGLSIALVAFFFFKRSK